MDNNEIDTNRESERREKVLDAMDSRNENLDGMDWDNIEKKLTGYVRKPGERSMEEIFFDDDDDDE